MFLEERFRGKVCPKRVFSTGIRDPLRKESPMRQYAVIETDAGLTVAEMRSGVSPEQVAEEQGESSSIRVPTATTTRPTTRHSLFKRTRKTSLSEDCVTGPGGDRWR